MLYYINLPKVFGQLSFYYPVYHDTKVPVLLLSETCGIAKVLTPSGIIAVESKYLAPCQ